MINTYEKKKQNRALKKLQSKETNESQDIKL
jgi:hypothetical protein